jgi:hypothetical protein
MEVKINIDETMFKDVVEKELAAIPAEKIQEVILEAMKKLLTENGNMRGLFVKEEKPQYSSYVNYTATPLLYKAAEKFNLDPAFTDIEQQIIEELKVNYPKILTEVLSNVLLRGFCQGNDFRMAIQTTIMQMSNQNR